jgi:hypothetical protein
VVLIDWTLFRAFLIMRITHTRNCALGRDPSVSGFTDYPDLDHQSDKIRPGNPGSQRGDAAQSA